MRPLFKTLIMAGALTLGSSWLPVVAQGPDPAKQLEHLTDTLLLTPEQATQVSGILQETQKKRQELVEAQKPQREAFRKSMSSLHDEARAKFSKVLNPEQLARFDKMHEERKARHMQQGSGKMMGEGMGMHHGPGRKGKGMKDDCPAMSDSGDMNQDTE
ncbi:MAG: hypothetical protein IPM37_06565 [Hahellaceae bacterium]|nr:hypothetical protein [Hahellaceae bacterium]